MNSKRPEIVSNVLNELGWEFDGGACQWTATSKIHDENIPFVWRIDVNENGKFVIFHSDRELLNSRPFPLQTLHDAKEWCEAEEKDLTCPVNPSQ